MTLVASSTSYIVEKTIAAPTSREKLHTFITSSLAYQGTRPKHFTALLEIIFNARTPDNVPYYKLNDEEDEPVMLVLQQLLQEGQAQGVFRTFNVYVMANAIQGAIGEYLLNPSLHAKVDLESYGEELVDIFDKTVVL
jgi:TetR/AcrR family transcriptional repressor of bet genes